MKPGLLIINLILLFSVTTHSQPPVNMTDTMQFTRLLDRAGHFFDIGQYDSAISISDKAIRKARELKFLKGEALAQAKKADVLIEQRKLESAEVCANEVNRLAKKTNDSLMAGISLLQLGQVKMYNDQPDEAILLMDKSITSGLGNFPNDYLALAFNELGYAWGMKGEYEKQVLFAHKSLGVYETLKNDAGMAIALSNLSTVYYNMDQKNKAIEYGKQSLKYREKTGDAGRLSITCCNLSQYYLGINNEEASKYQELCVKYARLSGDEAHLIHSYITSSLVANRKKNNKEAFEYELKVIDLLEKSKSKPDERMWARRYIAAAYYTDVLHYDSTVTLGYYNKSIKLSRAAGDKNNLKDVYLYLSEYYKGKSNFAEAYNNYKTYILYRDSLVDIEKEEKIAELESRYETNRKDNEIARLNDEQKIKQLEIDKQKAIIAGNTAMALQKQNEIDLLSKSRELQEVKIRQQGEELEKQLLLYKTNEQQLQLKEKENQTNAQQLQLTEKDNQLKQRQLKNQRNVRNLLIGSLILFMLLGFTFFNRYQLKRKLEQQTQLLEMRNNISQDLHDDIGASLSNINILNELARRNLIQPEKSREYLLKASEDIQRINESLSDIVWNINPRYDDMQNLFIRMKRYAADMLDGNDISGQFDFPADGPGINLSMTQRRDLYLIFKEAINNLAKYSAADQAVVSVTTGHHVLEVVVRDNGKGFDQATVNRGNGLHNMQQRAKALGADLKIESVPGKGTQINLLLKIS